jgi:hypothetical protein
MLMRPTKSWNRKAEQCRRPLTPVERAVVHAIFHDGVPVADGAMRPLSYAGADPVNFSDPNGTEGEAVQCYASRIVACTVDQVTDAARGQSESFNRMSPSLGGGGFVVPFAGYAEPPKPKPDPRPAAGPGSGTVVEGSVVLATVSGVGGQGAQLTEHRGPIHLGTVTVASGGSLLAPISAVSLHGYRNITVVYAFHAAPPGKSPLFSLGTGVVNLRFENSQRFFALGTMSLTGRIGVYHERSFTVPTGTNRISAYPSPVTPALTEVRFYGRR